MISATLLLMTTNIVEMIMIEFLHQSQIGMFFRCPEQFRRRYIEEEIIPPGIAARIGSGMHKGAEYNHKNKLLTGKDEPLSVCQDAARDEYRRLIFDYGVFFPKDELPSAKQQLSQGVDVTVGLTKSYHKNLAPLVHPILVEKKIYLKDPDIEIPFVGTVDLLAHPNWLADMKSAAKKWPENRIKSDIQVTLYRELIKAETGKYPSKMTVEVFTKTKEFRHQTLEAERTGQDWILLKKRVQSMLKMIKAGCFPPGDPGSWICSAKWCGYWQSCPYTK